MSLWPSEKEKQKARRESREKARQWEGVSQTRSLPRCVALVASRAPSISSTPSLPGRTGEAQ